MKDVIKLVENKNITLEYECTTKSGQRKNRISLFYMEEYGYCLYQSGAVDAEYKEAKDAIEDFYKLINIWETTRETKRFIAVKAIRQKN